MKKLVPYLVGTPISKFEDCRIQNSKKWKLKLNIKRCHVHKLTGVNVMKYHVTRDYPGLGLTEKPAI